MQGTVRNILVTVVLVLLSAAVSGAQTPEDQLAAAEAKWAANKPKAYEFTFKLLACCIIRVIGTGSEPIVFRVEDGVGSLTGVWAARPQASQGFEKYSTVEKLFAAIREELAKHRPYRVGIDYDPVLGYPKRFYAKRFQNAADDEYTFTVEGFRLLARQ